MARPRTTLAPAVAIALGGCATGGDRPSAGDATATSASSCEQQYEQAVQNCQVTADPEMTPEEFQNCRAAALEELQACRGG